MPPSFPFQKWGRREQGRSEEERDERTAEQREIDELTKDQRTVFVSQLVMKAGGLGCVLTLV